MANTPNPGERGRFSALSTNQNYVFGGAGLISGNGTLTKSGNGTLTLVGANSYTGGTTVSAGTLKGNTTSLQGAIANNAAVTFGQVLRAVIRHQLASGNDEHA